MKPYSAASRDTHNRNTNSLNSFIGGHRNLWLATVGLLVLLLGLLSLAIRANPMSSKDRSVLDWVTGWDAPGLTGYFDTLNTLAAPWPSVAIGAAGLTFLWLVGMRREATAFAVIGSVAGFLGFLSGCTFEELVSRSRPQLSSSDSFPSGHTLTATLLFGFTGLLGVHYGLRKRYLAPLLGFLFLLVLSVGAARIHVQAHWPSDVAAGFLLGGLAILVLTPLLLRCRRIEWLPSSIWGPPSG